jgi:hypothetical protein
MESMPLRTGETKIQNWKAEMKKFEGPGEAFLVPTQVNYYEALSYSCMRP